MGYILVEDEWCRKDSTQEKYDLLKVSKTMSNPMFQVLKELEELKDCMKTIEEGVVLLQELTSQFLQLGKDTNFDLTKVRLTIYGFNQEGTKLFFKVFSHLDSFKAKAIFSNNDLAIFVQNSYSLFSKNVEKSYE